MRYRQEFFKGHAEDRAKIVSLSERVKVPLRRYRHTLMTLETTPLEPDVLEAKFYARGVGRGARRRAVGRRRPRGADRYGRRPNQARLRPPPSSSSTSPPPANATVTSRFSCLDESRVPRFGVDRLAARRPSAVSKKRPPVIARDLASASPVSGGTAIALA